MTRPDTERVAYGPFGGLASGMAVCFTHPLDLIKVHKQILTVEKGTFGYGAEMVRSKGPSSLYAGLSASLGRQMTYKGFLELLNLQIFFRFISQTFKAVNL